MTKIIIISCFLAAVCIFQTEAGLFDLTANSLLDNVQKLVPSNVRENIHKLGETIQNRGKEGIKNALETSEKQLQTSTACTNVYNEVQEIISQLISAFNSCFSNGIDTVNTIIERFISAINNLKGNPSKDFQDTLKCFLNISEAGPCLNNNFQNFIKQSLNILEEVVNTALESSPKMFPKITMCYNDALLQLANYEKFDKLIKNMKQCTENVMPKIFSVLIPIYPLPFGY